MPWTGSQFAKRHNKKLTSKQAAIGAKVANQVLEKTGNEGRAIREGNAAGDKAYTKRGKR